MTEQQAQSPIDDLFRKTLENLPASPAESGWDTPSDRVWQHIQANIAQPRKGLSLQSILLLVVLGLSLAAGLFWMFAPAAVKPAPTPAITPVEQPAHISPVETSGTPVVKPSKPATGTLKPASPRNSTEENHAKPGQNAAQPLPGSKQTLPPNSTEAQKKKSSNN